MNDKTNTANDNTNDSSQIQSKSSQEVSQSITTQAIQSTGSESWNCHDSEGKTTQVETAGQSALFQDNTLPPELAQAGTGSTTAQMTGQESGLANGQSSMSAELASASQLLGDTANLLKDVSSLGGNNDRAMLNLSASAVNLAANVVNFVNQDLSKGMESDTTNGTTTSGSAMDTAGGTSAAGSCHRSGAADAAGAGNASTTGASGSDGGTIAGGGGGTDVPLGTGSTSGTGTAGAGSDTTGTGSTSGTGSDITGTGSTSGTGSDTTGTGSAAGTGSDTTGTGATAGTGSDTTGTGATAGTGSDTTGNGTTGTQPVTTADGTAGTGGLTATVNGFFNSQGQPVNLIGVDASPEDLAATTPSQLLQDFPGLTAIRMFVGPTGDGTGLGGISPGPNDPNIAQDIQNYTAAGVTVELEMHDANGQIGGFDSTYEQWAQQYKNNPLVMLETPNEPGGSASDVASQEATYIEEMRAQGFTNPIGVQPVGGYDTSNIPQVLQDLQNDGASTSNLYMTPHIYYNGTDPNGALQYAQSEAGDAQSNGMPALIDEYGNSIDGSTMDPLGQQTLEAIQTMDKQGYGTQAQVGSTFWGLYFDHPDGADSAFADPQGVSLTQSGQWLSQNTLA